MKTTTLIVLAGIAVALCGCTTDSPVFANEYTKSNGNAVSSVNPGSDTAAAGASNAEVARSIVNVDLSGASMGDQNPGGNSHAENSQSMNPYAH